MPEQDIWVATWSWCRARICGVGPGPAAAAGLDPESAEWLRALDGAGAGRETALARLHELLLRIALGEVRRRGPRLQVSGPELDDLAHQAAAHAQIAITGKLGQFRGESRFTTWAYRFVLLEVSAKIGRPFWRHPDVPLDAEDWVSCRAGSALIPLRRPNGGICWPRCGAPWMKS